MAAKSRAWLALTGFIVVFAGAAHGRDIGGKLFASMARSYIPSKAGSCKTSSRRQTQLCFQAPHFAPAQFERSAVKVGDVFGDAQALSMAGGFNAYAEENKTKIFREKAGKTLILDFRYNDVAKG